jgi:hypothetical protein
MPGADLLPAGHLGYVADARSPAREPLMPQSQGRVAGQICQ